eukprot:1599459-Prymnesium_polylepis.1
MRCEGSTPCSTARRQRLDSTDSNAEEQHQVETEATQHERAADASSCVARGGDEPPGPHAPCVSRGCVKRCSHLLNGSPETSFHPPKAADAS